MNPTRVFIHGLEISGRGTKGLFFHERYSDMIIEDLGKPVVLLANNGFVTDAHSAASGKGMPGIRVVGSPIPCEATVAADIEAGVAGAMRDLVDGLTKPLSPEEKSPKPKVAKLPRIAFKGNYEEVNRYFYGKGWTDGLPIVPPTEKAVAEMLRGTEEKKRRGFH